MTAPANPLVAERQDSTTAISGIGIAESAVDLYNGISSGSWSEIAIGGAGMALETVGLVIDPIGSLVAAGISWLIEHVEPLTDALDWLAGDPDTIASYAQTWRNVAGAVNGSQQSFTTAVAQQTAQWTGSAGDAYRTAATRQADQLTATATASRTPSAASWKSSACSSGWSVRSSATSSPSASPPSSPASRSGLPRRVSRSAWRPHMSSPPRSP